MSDEEAMDNRSEEHGTVLSFRLTADLMAAVDNAAAQEGISKSDVARRALLQDRRVRAAMAE
jgi:predicted transcriptional regulator